MENLINDFLSNIAFLGNGAYWILFGAAMLDSIAVVGLLVPGTTLQVLMGFLASERILNFKIMLLVITLGNIIGDTISFYLGRRGVAWFKPGNKIFKMEYIEKGEAFFRKHGDKSILLARFFGPLRPIVPFVAGLFRMRSFKFLLFNIIGGFLAALFYLSLGYFFGHAFHELQRIFKAVEWVLVSVGVFMVLLFIFKSYLIKEGQEIVVGIRAVFHPFWLVFLEHHARLKNFLALKRQFHFSISFFGSVFLICILSVAIISKIIIGVYDNALMHSLDNGIDEWLYLHRRDFLDTALFALTFLGGTKVVALVVGGISFALVRCKKFVYLISLWISMGGAGVMVWITKHWIERPRPLFIAAYNETGFSFPSGHAMGAMVVYGWLIFFTWRESKKWSTKINVLFGALSMIVLMGFTRLYLGVHYLSDVVTGFTIGLLWLGVGIGVQKMMLRIRQKTEVNGK